MVQNGCLQAQIVFRHSQNHYSHILSECICLGSLSVYFQIGWLSSHKCMGQTPSPRELPFHRGNYPFTEGTTLLPMELPLHLSARSRSTCLPQHCLLIEFSIFFHSELSWWNMAGELGGEVPLHSHNLLHHPPHQIP